MVGSGKQNLHHFMVEVYSLDDVGQGYDLAQLEDGRVAYTLGRHTNDYMTSFYSHSPSGFFVEYGWGGRVIDPGIWQPHETNDGPSLWGHERLYMEPEQRAQLREMRLSAAARGVRAPVRIPDCPWLETVIAPQIVERVGLVHVMRFQKLIELGPRAEAQQPTQLGLGRERLVG